MDKEQVTKLIGKIKETVGENNYKLALAITGHRPGKIRDITMASKDGELLLEYIDNLEQQVKKQKEVINKITDLIKQYGKYDGEKCTRGFQMWSADFNKILDMLKEVSE